MSSYILAKSNTWSAKQIVVILNNDNTDTAENNYSLQEWDKLQKIITVSVF